MLLPRSFFSFQKCVQNNRNHTRAEQSTLYCIVFFFFYYYIKCTEIYPQQLLVLRFSGMLHLLMQNDQKQASRGRNSVYNIY